MNIHIYFRPLNEYEYSLSIFVLEMNMNMNEGRNLLCLKVSLLGNRFNCNKHFCNNKRSLGERLYVILPFYSSVQEKS